MTKNNYHDTCPFWCCSWSAPKPGFLKPGHVGKTETTNREDLFQALTEFAYYKLRKLNKVNKTTKILK